MKKKSIFDKTNKRYAMAVSHQAGVANPPLCGGYI
jgi:hypothetical protein